MPTNVSSSSSSVLSTTCGSSSTRTNRNDNETTTTCSSNDNKDNNNNKRHSTRPHNGNNIHTNRKNAPIYKNNTKRTASTAASTSVTATASIPAPPPIVVNITQGKIEYTATIIDSTVLAVFHRKKDDKSKINICLHWTVVLNLDQMDYYLWKTTCRSIIHEVSE